MRFKGIYTSSSRSQILTNFQAVDLSKNLSLGEQFAELSPDEYKAYLILFKKNYRNNHIKFLNLQDDR